MTLPNFLRSPDPDFRDFTLEQADALAEQRRVWSLRGQEDAWHAGVEELREDGAKVVKPLTLARLERFAAECDNGVRHRGWSLSPEPVK